jgi:hypothetical protein
LFAKQRQFNSSDEETNLSGLIVISKKLLYLFIQVI